MSPLSSSPVVYSVCDIPITAATPGSAADVIVQRAHSGGSFEVHLCNAYTLSLVEDDPQLREALLHADLNLPDGSPVAWLGRRHGTRGPVRGPRLVEEVCRRGVQHGLNHFLYGGAEGVAELVQAELERRAPGLVVSGAECPPWRDLDDSELEELAQRIKHAGADVVWIGLGTPRQDYLVRRLGTVVNCVVVPVGAAFDFLAGRVGEAPTSLHGSGFEWVHRLIKEPRRLWRRYLIGNPKFLVRAIRSRPR